MFDIPEPKYPVGAFVEVARSASPQRAGAVARVKGRRWFTRLNTWAYTLDDMRSPIAEANLAPVVDTRHPNEKSTWADCPWKPKNV